MSKIVTYSIIITRVEGGVTGEGKFRRFWSFFRMRDRVATRRRVSRKIIVATEFMRDRVHRQRVKGFHTIFFNREGVSQGEIAEEDTSVRVATRFSRMRAAVRGATRIHEEAARGRMSQEEIT